MTAILRSEITKQNQGATMQDIDQANRYAAQMAVEYLDEIKTYDLRELGEERFKILIELINRNYHEKLIDIQND